MAARGKLTYKQPTEMCTMQSQFNLSTLNLFLYNCANIVAPIAHIDHRSGPLIPSEMKRNYIL